MYRSAQPEDWLPHIRHMLEAAERVTSYVGELSEAEFDTNDVVCSATRLKIILIGEAASRLTDDLRSEIPDIPWHRIRRMRNIIVHEDDCEDEEPLWDTATVLVPRLATTLRGVLAEHGE